MAGSCNQCGAALGEHEMFCTRCGARRSQNDAPAVEKHFCGKCGSELKPDLRFCETCGNRIEPAVAPNAGTVAVNQPSGQPHCRRSVGLSTRPATQYGQRRTRFG